MSALLSSSLYTYSRLKSAAVFAISYKAKAATKSSKIPTPSIFYSTGIRSLQSFLSHPNNRMSIDGKPSHWSCFMSFSVLCTLGVGSRFCTYSNVCFFKCVCVSVLVFIIILSSPVLEVFCMPCSVIYVCICYANLSTDCYLVSRVSYHHSPATSSFRQA